MEYTFVLSGRGTGKYEAYKKLNMDIIKDEIENAEKAREGSNNALDRMYQVGYADGLRHALMVLGGGKDAII